MKNFTIIHGSSSHEKEILKRGEPQQNKRNWIPWLKKELESKGFQVNTPLMPNNDFPNYNEWKTEFEKIEVNKDSTLIGHSAGGTFLARWLGETKKSISRFSCPSNTLWPCSRIYS